MIPRVLVACEFSGIVRDAFVRAGCDAWSADILDSERPGNHLKGDIFDAAGRWQLGTDWDLLIAHPPCTHLAVSGARWFPLKRTEQARAIWFFMGMISAPVPRVCVENPVSIMSTRYRKPDQIIQPWQFGHGEKKATCLWLRGLPLLLPTRVVDGRSHRIHLMGPNKDRWKDRSRTYEGIADAMASQWTEAIRATF